MRKGLGVIILCSITILTALPIYPQEARRATIEPGTKALLTLQSRLSSKLNEVGDTFTATLNESIYVNGELVIPRDAEFLGRVAAVKPAGRSQRGAEMTVTFENVLTPWGEEPVYVVLTSIDDWDKNEKLKADSEGKVKGGRRGKQTLENVLRGGQLGGLGTGSVILARGGGIGRGGRAGGGAAMAGGMVGGLLLTKGGEVRLEPGAVLRIEFVKPLTLPVTRETKRVP